jgi:trimeric autotransporter adhesin
MKMQIQKLFIMAIWLLDIYPAIAQPTVFTYQGRLGDSGNPVNGIYDFRFRLDADASGNTILATVLTNAIPVSNGLFTTTIDFGANYFNGSNYWLEVGVRTNGAAGYTDLTPLQAITPVPYAQFAQRAGNLLSSAQLDVSGLTIENNTNGAPNVIGGSSVNYVASGVIGATISGGGGPNSDGFPFANSVTGDFGTVGGGEQNTASYEDTVSGGYHNTTSSTFATVGGGTGNTASGMGATVGGGENNTASNLFSIVSGGTDNIANGEEATVGGGGYNTAGGAYSTVGGGTGNVAMINFSTVSGGEDNTASNLFSIVSGGVDNIANGEEATVSGGTGNTASGWAATVGGGGKNIASGYGTTVSGGVYNTAGGVATVAGGGYNTASGDYSFAAGYYARALHPGTFVWADDSSYLNSFSSTSSNQFLIRATGGVGIGTNAPGYTLDVNGDIHASGNVYAGSVELTSDRNAKENFESVNPETVLAKVTSLPISEWNYKTALASQRHLGPMAQDFHAAFDLNGKDDKHISVIDEGGVALAAIQGLNEKLQAALDRQTAENARLKQQNDLLAQRLNELALAVKSLDEKK